MTAPGYLQIADAFKSGMDTMEIAAAYDVPEAVIYNQLQDARDRAAYRLVRRDEFRENRKRELIRLRREAGRI